MPAAPTQGGPQTPATLMHEAASVLEALLPHWLTKGGDQNLWRVAPVDFDEAGQATVHEPILARNTLKACTTAIKRMLGQSVL